MQDLEKFKNEMNLSGKNVYVGHRYVPKIFGDWDNTQIYEPLSIVQYQGNSFTSRQYVPTGIEITNEDYWVSTGNYNAQIEQYRQDVQGFKNDLESLQTETTDSLTTMNTTITNINTKINNQRIANVRDFGAKGDGVTDDTQAFKQALQTDFRYIYIPSGRYRITESLKMPPEFAGDNVHIFGSGSRTILLNDVPTNHYLFHNTVDEPIGGFTLEHFDIKPYGIGAEERDDVKGIHVGYATRVNRIHNVRIWNQKTGIYFGGKIEGQTSLVDVGIYNLRTMESEGLIVDGNTVFATNLEILGATRCVTWRGSVGAIKGGNIGGTTGFYSEEAFIFDGAKNVQVSNIWVERLSNEKYGFNLARAVEMFSGENITLSNMHFATGSVVVHDGDMHIENSKFWGGGRTGIKAVGKNAKVLSTNNKTLYYGLGTDDIHTDGQIVVSPTFDSLYNGGKKGLLTNPTLKDGTALPIEVTNATLSSITKMTDEFYSGENAYKVSVNATYEATQGAKVKANVNFLNDRLYTFVARVRSVDGKKIYMRTDGNSKAEFRPVAPNRRASGDNQYEIITLTVKPSGNDIYVNIVGSNEFIIDSVNVFDGVVASNPDY